PWQRFSRRAPRSADSTARNSIRFARRLHDGTINPDHTERKGQMRAFRRGTSNHEPPTTISDSATFRNRWMFDVGCWMLGVGCWVLDVGCWMLDVRCWMFDVRSLKFFHRHPPNARIVCLHAG